MSTKLYKHSTGLTIVELMVALAVTALLLTAVAAAFNASVKNYTENEDIYKTVHTAQQALFRMISQLRTADSVDPDTPSNECTLFTHGGDNITYRYNNGDNKLYLITNDDLSDSDYVLCDNVTAMTCTKNTVIDEDMQIKVKNVQISMTVVSGNVQRKVSAAAVIRRNLK